jgi:hypothetical protein
MKGALDKVLKSFLDAPPTEDGLKRFVTIGMDDFMLCGGEEPFPTESLTLESAQLMYPNIHTFPTVNGDGAEVTEDFLESIAREIYASRPVQMTPVEMSDDDSKANGEKVNSGDKKKKRMREEKSRNTKTTSLSELKNELLAALNKGASINALKVCVTDFLLKKSGINVTVTKGGTRKWLNDVMSMVHRVFETEETSKDTGAVIPEKDKEEEDYDDDDDDAANDDEEEVDSNESEQKKAKSDIEDFLYAVFSQCLAPNGMQSDDEEEEEQKEEDDEEEDSERLLQDVLNMDQQLSRAAKKTWQSTLLRGYYIETREILYRHSLGMIADALGLGRTKASSNDALTVPREIYRFIVKTGMYMLLFFQPCTRKVTAKAIYTRRKAIQEYFQDNPEELKKWKEGIEQPTKKTVVIKKKRQNWVDYKWLLQE